MECKGAILPDPMRQIYIDKITKEDGYENCKNGKENKGSEKEMRENDIQGSGFRRSKEADTYRQLPRRIRRKAARKIARQMKD